MTDEESRIIPKAGGGFVQAYNAQAAVNTVSLCIPRKLDTDSTPNWTVIPRQTGQSERSDARWMGCTPGRLRGSSC